MRGAFLNVRINAAGCDDKAFVGELIRKGNALVAGSDLAETAILKIVEEKMTG